MNLGTAKSQTSCDKEVGAGIDPMRLFIDTYIAYIATRILAL